MTSVSLDSRPPTAQKEGPDSSVRESGTDWRSVGASAYRSSTSYVDSNLRAVWDNSLRAFYGQHATSSKYNSPSFDKRSKLFRPKTRTIIRKNEAAAAAAFFSNMELVDISAEDDSSPEEVASASVMTYIMKYRLKKSIKWFHTVLGGIQEAQTVGAVCAHIHWKYKAQPAVTNAAVEVEPAGEPQVTTQEGAAALPTGAFTLGAALSDDSTPIQQTTVAQPVDVAITAEVKPKPIEDRPVIELVPIENIRIDAAADWTDPVNSSPFFIHLIPMYVMDVKAKIEEGEWVDVADQTLKAATTDLVNSTRLARQNGKGDPTQPDDHSIEDYDIVWVRRHIHRHKHGDIEFYMIGEELLSDPVPLVQNVLHGMRPYVIGVSVLEAHSVFPSSIPTLAKDLQEQTNEIANQRIDNVKFALNKKWFAKRGKDVDIAGLVRNVPGGVVMLDDPDKDVREISFPDVTQSAYEEQSRLDNDMSELLGNFSAAQVMADHGINGPARNMQMLNQSAGTLVEYLLRTYVETFIEPVLRQLMQLIQKYETDETILALAGKKAQLFQKYGINQMTDSLLEKELNLCVNVGMGATDPQMKLQKFMAGITSYAGILEKNIAGLNTQEVGAEIFSHLGYRSPARFLTGADPQVLKLQQQMQALSKQNEQLKMALQNKTGQHVVNIQKTAMEAKTKILDTQIREAHADKRAEVTHLRALLEMQGKQRHERTMQQLDIGHSLHQKRLEDANPKLEKLTNDRSNNR